MTQLSLSGVAVEFGATPILRDVSVTIAAGEKWGIVGRNGSGKTTLFRLITGTQAPTRGALSRVPGLRVTLLEQHRDLGDANTVWEAVAGAFGELRALEQKLAAQATRMGELGADAPESLMEAYGHDLERFEREGGYTMESRIDAALSGLGFDPGEARTRPLTALSGGERGRLSLARQLVTPADVLLLDEPTNHLDLETTRWLERYLRDSDRTILLISHDRAFLANVADHVLHVEAGTAVAYSCGYEAFVQLRIERRMALQRSVDKQNKVVAKEEDYVRRNLAGVNSRQAKGRRKRLVRLPRLSAPPSEEDSMALRLDNFDRGGDQVLVTQKLKVTMGENVLLRDFTGMISRGERIALVGPNGTGKSTLLRTLLGEHSPAEGIARIGSGIMPSYYRQDLAGVPMGRALYDIIQDLRPLWNRGQIQSHLARFGFPGDEVQRTADTLSGGERARVALAQMVLARANFLVLDEPTNHLDVESIEALEDALDAYGGTVLLVSHDRALLRSAGDRVWSLEDGRIEDFPGSFEEWEVQRAGRERAVRDATQAAGAAKRDAARQKTERRDTGSGEAKRAIRDARRSVEQAERTVVEREAKVAELTAAIEDPALYSGADGARRSAELGSKLAQARAALDAALSAWALAEERASALVADGD